MRIPPVLGVVTGGVLVASLLGGGQGFIAAALLVVVLRLALRLVPIYAHRAFERGRYARAAWLWRGLGLVVISKSWQTAICVSVAGCRIAQAEYAAGRAELERVALDTLLPSARAAWLNNAVYAYVRSGPDVGDALGQIDEAIRLSPEVPGYYHTRGLVLLALGRKDDGIALLDDLWRRLGEAPPPLLEAERCFDLGRAWQEKGELDYARDYYERVCRVAPRSSWARQAEAKLETWTGDSSRGAREGC